MASYRIEISATAAKQLSRLPRAEVRRVTDAILALAGDPHPTGCRKLSGYKDVFRIRIGVYRVLYSVDRNRVVVIILKVGNRREVYR